MPSCQGEELDPRSRGALPPQSTERMIDVPERIIPGIRGHVVWKEAPATRHDRDELAVQRRLLLGPDAHGVRLSFC